MRFNSRFYPHTSFSASEPLKHADELKSAQFSPDDQRVVTASKDKTVRIWEVPTVLLPAPDWIPKLTEAIGGKRFGDQEIPESTLLNRDNARVKFNKLWSASKR
jgi:WD40 repeat protein